MPKNHHDYKFPVEVRATIDMGNGVFATRDIKRENFAVSMME